MESLPRSEVVEVDSLRGDWEDLVTLADTTRHLLLHDQRHIHQRETEKQVHLLTFTLPLNLFQRTLQIRRPLYKAVLLLSLSLTYE